MVMMKLVPGSKNSTFSELLAQQLTRESVSPPAPASLSHQPSQAKRYLAAPISTADAQARNTTASTCHGAL